MEFITKKVYRNSECFLVAEGPEDQYSREPFVPGKYLKKQFERLKVKHCKAYNLPLKGWMSWTPEDKEERIYINRDLSNKKLQRKPYAGYLIYNGADYENKD